MQEAELVRLVLKDHAPAMQFFTHMAKASQTLDDLMDGDKYVPRPAREALCWNLLITLPANPFYQQYQDRLRPVMEQVLMDWFVANELERSDGEHDRRIAFVIRNNLVQLLGQCALIIGGPDWQRQHALAMRRFVHDESFETYLEGL